MPYPAMNSVCERLPQTADKSRTKVEMARLARRVSQRGQAMPEYILLIGLVSIFILSSLFLFRNAIADFTHELVAYFQSQSGTEAEAEPPPPPPPPPPAPPAKSPDEELANWLVGRWCAPHVNWIASPSGQA